MKERISTSSLLWVVVLAVMAAAVYFVAQVDTTGRRGTEIDRYDLRRFRETSPEQVLPHRHERILTLDLTEPRGIAVGGRERLYVAGDDTLCIYRLQDDEVTLTRRVALSQPAACVAEGPDGTVYIGLADRLALLPSEDDDMVLAPILTGTPLVTALAVGSDVLYVADAGNRVVWRCDPIGNVLGEIGRKDPRRHAEGFVIPSGCFDLALAADGLLRVVSPGRHRIEAYTPDGYMEFHWGRAGMDVEGFCGCCNPAHIALTPDGKMVTAEKGLVRVKLYDADGRFEGLLAGPDAFAAPGPQQPPKDGWPETLDVAVATDGVIYVLDPYEKSVRRFVMAD